MKRRPARATLEVPQKPAAPEFDQIPGDLRARSRWLCWRYGPPKGASPKWCKVPYSAAGKKARYTDPAEWQSFDAAVRQYRRGGYDGIGFVLGGGICGLDEDHCIHEGRFSEEATRHLQLLDSYAEFSVSGDGAHSLAYGTLPSGGRMSGDHELYADNRFFVVTGQRLSGSPEFIAHREAELHQLHAMIFGAPVDILSDNTNAPARPQCVTQFSANTQEGGRGSSSGLRDAQVIALVKRDDVAGRYWDGCPTGVNPSRADFALACKLAFYTGGDLNQMERLFKRSGLAKRAKARTRRGSVDYVQYTLRNALLQQTATWKPSKKSKALRPIGRPLSETTQRVVALASDHPMMAPAKIAKRLGLRAGTVRTILYRRRLAALRQSGRQAA